MPLEDSFLFYDRGHLKIQYILCQAIFWNEFFRWQSLMWFSLNFTTPIVLTMYLASTSQKGPFNKRSFWKKVLLTKGPLKKRSFCPKVLWFRRSFGKGPLAQRSFWLKVLLYQRSFAKVLWPKVLLTKVLRPPITFARAWLKLDIQGSSIHLSLIYKGSTHC